MMESGQQVTKMATTTTTNGNGKNGRNGPPISPSLERHQSVVSVFIEKNVLIYIHHSYAGSV